jgi:hypothetical protein
MSYARTRRLLMAARTVRGDSGSVFPAPLETDQ